MDLVQLVLVIACVGLMVWVVETMIPMPPEFIKAIRVVCIVGLVFYVLHAFGLFAHLPRIMVQ